MNITIPLYPGTLLANVRYYWIVLGVRQPTQSSGISQPDSTIPMFVFSVTPPAGADEIIAFDATAPTTNWNPGGYKNIEVGPVPPPAIITAPPYGPPGMRVVSLREVLEAVLREFGLDPVGENTPHDAMRDVIRNLNTWMRYAWRYWEWPQLEVLQQRAFRTQWTNTLQFYRVGFEGNPDEVYNPADQNYYRVNATAPTDPPVGDPPTDPVYWTLFTLTDRYILLDQVNQTPIGEVIEVFAADPRLDAYHYARRIPFQPTEREITVVGYPGQTPTVWVQFRIVVSKLTGVPYVPGKIYQLGDTMYDPTTGDCYRAAIYNPTGDPTAQPTQWIKVPIPEIFKDYLATKAYAAGIGELDPADRDPNLLAYKRQILDVANEEAESLLAAEVNRLQAQGQHYRYPRWRKPWDAWQWWSYPYVSPGAT